MVRRGVGVRTHGYAIELAVGRARLRDDVDGARRVLTLVLVRRRRCLVSRGGGISR
jgi:hypothetical protein